MNKAVIIINGAGGVGKDTICDLAAKHFKVKNISSITPIKELAARCGWGGEKDDKARKFLSDLDNFLGIWYTFLIIHIHRGKK
jgi:adenylate kinase